MHLERKLLVRLEADLRSRTGVAGLQALFALLGWAAFAGWLPRDLNQISGRVAAGVGLGLGLLATGAAVRTLMREPLPLLVAESDSVVGDSGVRRFSVARKNVARISSRPLPFGFALVRIELAGGLGSRRVLFSQTAYVGGLDRLVADLQTWLDQRSRGRRGETPRD